MTIKSKLVVLLLLTALIPTVVISYWTFYKAKQALQETTISGLNTIAEFKEGEIYLYIENLKTNTRDYASDGFIRDELSILSQHNSPPAQTAAYLNRHLIDNKLPLNKELLYIEVLDSKGKVIASTDKTTIGLDQSSKVHFIQGLTQTYVSDIHDHDNIEIEVATPIKTRSQPYISLGVLVNHYSANNINKLFTGDRILELGARTQVKGFGKTGETYLVNKQKLMITDSIFVPNAPFRQTVDTYPVIQAFTDDREVSGFWRDYRGVPVVGASMILEVGETKWVLVTEIDAKEAFSQIYHLEIRVIFAGALFLALALVAAYLLANNFSTPIVKLKQHIDKISKGELGDHVFDIRNRDEIGFLANAFNEMSDNLLRSQRELEFKNKELSELSVKDGLTKIFNHRYLMEFITREFNRAQRYNSPLSCLIIDIDHFKSVNDNHGHLYGDFALAEVAKLLSSFTRKADVVGRYGGEEFLLILTNTKLDQACAVAEKIRKFIEQYRFSQEDITQHLTVSIGVSKFRHTHQSASQIIDDADKALYRAKNSGRNRVCTSEKNNPMHNLAV